MTEDETLCARIKVLRAEMNAYAETVERRIQAIEAKYSPDQPRDDHGRWTGGGNSPSGGNSTAKPGWGERIWQETFGSKPAAADEVPKPKPIDANRAAQHAINNIDRTHEFGNGKCATNVREAVEAGLGHPIPAKDLPPLRRVRNPKTGAYEETRWARDYGPTFEKIGLSNKIIIESGVGDHPLRYQPKIGDVAVIQPTSDPKHPEGHAAIYTRAGWVSDYKQGKNLYPNPRYRLEKPSYTIYRKPE